MDASIYFHKGANPMSKLKPCPCGKTPESIVVTTPSPSKWSFAVGNCCGNWFIEFRSQYKYNDELMALAEEEWNLAPRGTQ